MDILERIRQRAASRPQHIVLPEGNDPRTVKAAAMCARQRLAQITLLGDEATSRETAQREGADLGGVTVVDHRRAPDFEKMVGIFHEMRRAKGLMADEARTLSWGREAARCRRRSRLAIERPPVYVPRGREK